MSKTSRGEMFTSFPMGKHLFKVESISFIQKEISTGENTILFPIKFNNSNGIWVNLEDDFF